MKRLFLVTLFLLASMVCTALAFEQERIVVVGDLHGDVDQAKAILQLANVIDSEAKWIGGSHTKLVQMGDLVDRGEQDREVLDLFMKLQREAAEAGSELTLLLGNHEVMNMMGDDRYVHPSSIVGFGGKDQYKKLWAVDGYYGSWIRENFKLVHAHNGTLFVHAGLAASYAGYGIEKLNAATRTALKKNDFRNPLFGNDGPVWTRLLINRAEYGRCDMVEETLKKLGMDRMIVGHTPQRDQRVHAFCSGKLVAVDVGISKFMYGGLAAVEIKQNQHGMAVLEEIVPNDVDNRSEKEAEKLEQKGGMDMDMLQEMLQTVNELEGENKRKAELEERERLRKAKEALKVPAAAKAGSTEEQREALANDNKKKRFDDGATKEEKREKIRKMLADRKEALRKRAEGETEAQSEL